MSDFKLECNKEDNNYCEHISSDIWLVDNHRWAYYAWEKHRINKKINKFSLVHVDYHWDGGNEFHNLLEMEQKLVDSNLGDIFNFVKHDELVTFVTYKNTIDDTN